MPKISLVGAGSVVFARRLLQDVARVPALSDATISLMDVDADRLELITAFARRAAKDAGTRVAIESTQDRRQSLEGADYVLTTIRVNDDYAIDRGVPLKYGVNQSVADTVGPGGVFKALRTVPVLLDICEDMEAVCPDAWLLNYTNPMAIACWSIAEASDIQTVGLCHSVQRTTQQLADYIRAPRDSVTAWVAGINHLAWFLRFEKDGQDAYPQLWDALEDPEIFSKDPVRFEIMRYFGAFVTESTRHMSEYVPYFRNDPEVMEQFGLETITPDLSRLEERNEAHFAQIRQQLAGSELIVSERSDEYACRIIEAMETGAPTVINANVPNLGLIDNLPAGSCVEVPCLVDGLGVHPMAVGELPPQLASLSRANVAVQELATQAVLARDRESAARAVMLDPLTAAALPLASIREMFDEMWAAHGDQLADYA